MALRVNTNVSAINTQRWLGISGAAQSKALERLSSGYKINKAADDAAGVAIATKLSVKSVSMVKSIDNGNQALAMLQTAESGIDQISNILSRLKELAVQSASDNTTDRAALNTERGNLEAEIDKIARNTRFGQTQLLQGAKTGNLYGASLTVGNGIEDIDVTGANVSGGYVFTLTVVGNAGGTSTLTLTNGSTTQSVSVTGLTGLNSKEANFTSFGIKVTVNSAIATITAAGGFSVSVGTSSFDYQVGDTNLAENQISATFKNFEYSNSAVINISGDISSKDNARLYMDKVDTAVTNLTSERGTIGAAMNQISYHVANLEAMNENIKASISTIKDADFATEMADFTKNQILQQSGIAMLAQANQIPQLVLSLLK